ncbi:MAG TPA: hypothetical protein VIF62_37115, partial [Labilithrix sp.]
LAQIVDVVPVVGKRYVGQMWLRVGGAVTGKRAYVVVRTFDADGGEVEATGNQPVTLTTDYESVGTTLLVTKPAARLEIYSFVEAPTAPGDCFFADDATLVAR